jgi:hypothetical protein
MDTSRDISSLNSTETVVYPYCYKIKDSCLPNSSNNNASGTPTDCLKELSEIEKMSEPYINKEIKEKNISNLINCLKKYGDIYKQLNIELYVNPKTKAIIFPDNARIQSNLNLFLRENNFDEKDFENLEYKLMLFNILLNDNLRKRYNKFYLDGLADIESLKPKEYGIARIMGKEDNVGGKRKASKKAIKRKKKNTRKNKNRK